MIKTINLLIKIYFEQMGFPQKYNFEINIEDIEINKGVELYPDDIWECIHYILENIDGKLYMIFYH